ncbi:MAG: 8-oxo-dGTP diphosphatase [Chloroflexota bacterium]|nr:8-oxo-dGTP diphosphatase [Chloroflexota bacterium]
MNAVLATLCYVRQNSKTLMIHRVKKHNDIHEGKWNGLGGKIEAGETPEECAIREILEESGLVVKNLRLKGFLTFPQFANHQDWYAFVYVIDVFEGELIDSPEGVLHWINDSDLTNLNLWEGDRVFLPWLDQPGFFSAKFVYEDGNYIDHEVVFYDLE